MKKNYLIVNWGTENALFPLSETLRLNKHNVYLATSKDIPDNIKDLFDKNKLLFTNTYDVTQLCQDTVAFQKKHAVTFDVVTTFFEMNVFQTAFLADYLGCKKKLPVSSAMNTSVNKYLMRSKISQNNIQQPLFLKFSESETSKAYNFYKKMRKAVIIKPIHSGHSYGARKIDKNVLKHDFEQMVRSAKQDLFKSYDEWMNYEKKIKIDFLLEEFIPGKIYSFDGIVKKRNEIVVLGNAEFEVTEPPLLQQIGHTVPIATLNEHDQKLCLEYTKKIISILELQYCGFHCELKFYNGKPMLIEISGRLPGGEVLESYQATSGVNIFDAFLNVFEEKKRKILVNKERYKSETRITKYIPWTFGEVKEFLLDFKKNNNIKITIESRNKGDLVFEKRQSIGLWLYSIKIQSKILSSQQIITLRNAIRVTYSLSPLIGVRKILGTLKFYFMKYIRDLKNK